MSLDKKLVLISGGLKDTSKIAKRLAVNLKGNEVIELQSDLGGGKTTFTQFLVSALGSKDIVNSPSFTLQNIYQTPKFEIHHFDFYRLEDSGVVGQELDESIESGVLVIIEWAGIVNELLPSGRLTVKITALSDKERQFEFSCPNEMKYLLEGLES